MKYLFYFLSSFLCLKNSYASLEEERLYNNLFENYNNKV